MKRALFIDRDGTIIVEPLETEQIDTLEQLEFLPEVIRNLYRIVSEFDYELVMVSNQDGLGTKSYPEEDFIKVQDKMLQTLTNEGINFNDILIDKTFEYENAPTRKPGIAMLGKYLNGDYDLQNSYVIGDRITDVQLAKNIGSKGILIKQNRINVDERLRDSLVLETTNWNDIYSFLKKEKRKTIVRRKTNETDIEVEISLDGEGKSNITTGIGFYDHLLDQLSRHSGIDLRIAAKGDLHIDEHHTIEDIAITLGEALSKALGDKKGINRYGFCLPMDDALAQVTIDFGGRSWLVWDAEFKREKIGEMPTEMFYHIFKSLSDAAKMNINIKAEGINEHHKIEAVFKALAKALKMAIQTDDSGILPSTKGSL